jgi:hypothetical protein
MKNAFGATEYIEANARANLRALRAPAAISAKRRVHAVDSHDELI